MSERPGSDAVTLSIVPATRRPLIEIEPVGREADIAWLRAIQEDSVLSGEPGSGKTFLVYHLMRQGWPGLFLAPGPVDLSALALALQEKKPEIVVVDDAFADPGRLVDLLRLRREKEMRFRILATTWKGGESEVLAALGSLPLDRVHRLELLSRDEILQVFRSVGVAEGDELMRHLVDQAANKPGLAVTIATLWLQGSWQEVVEGDALSRTMTAFFEQYLGREATDVLAAFSLGGTRGMPQETVREFLELSRLDFRRILTGLHSGGALFEAGETTLVVRPSQLRAALLKTVFFPDEGGALPYRDLLARAPSRAKSVLALIETKATGGRIPDEELRGLVRETGAVEVWGALPWLSEDHARWVLENYEGDILDVVSGALDKVPQDASRRVLERAEELARAGDRVERAMGFLLSWARELLPNVPSREVQRRRELARAAARFLRSGGMPSIGAQGFLGALSPVRRTSTTDPGIGKTVKMWSGILPWSGLQEIEGIWEEFHGDLREIDRSTWLHLTRMLEDWIDPRHALFSAEISPETVQAMNNFAARILQDLVPLTEGSPGLASAFQRLAKRLNIKLAVAEDPHFSALLPDHPSGGAVQDLAEEWALRPAAEVARQLVFYYQEMYRIGGGWSENLFRLCRALATKVDEPGRWLEAFLDAEIPEPLAAPFLERLAEARMEGWQRQLERFLGNQVLAGTATAIVLALQTPPEPLLEEALRKAPQFPRSVEDMCLRGEVPLPTLRRLLLSTDPGVVSAAIIGEWASEPEGSVRDEIRAEWREAFLNWREDPYAVNTEYWLAEILGRDPGLAFAWLKARLMDEDPGLIREGPE